MSVAALLWPTLTGTLTVGFVAALVLHRHLRRRLADSEATLAESEADWMQALDFAEDAMYLVDLNDRLVRGNRKFFEFIRKTPEEAVGRDLMTLVHGAPESTPCPVCEARLAHRDAAFVKEADDPINRLQRPIEVIVRMRRDRQGAPMGVLMVIRDLTRQRAVERAVRESRERLQVILRSIGEGVITTDVHGRVEYINPVAEDLTGWPTDAAVGRPLSDVFPLREESSGTTAADPAAACLAQGAIIESPRDNILVRRDGTKAAVEHTAAPIRDATGHVFGAVIAFRDVTTMRGLARQLSYQASHDALTGLINRREFESRLAQALQNARAGPPPRAVLSGPGPVQGGQRYLRPRRGRSTLEADNQPAQRTFARARRDRAPRRRRVRFAVGGVSTGQGPGDRRVAAYLGAQVPLCVARQDL